MSAFLDGFAGHALAGFIGGAITFVLGHHFGMRFANNLHALEAAHRARLQKMSDEHRSQLRELTMQAIAESQQGPN
jgi:hypothetical protein